MTSIFTKKPLFLLLTFFVVTLFLSSDAADFFTSTDDCSSTWSANIEADPMHTILDKLNDRCADDFFGAANSVSCDNSRVVSLRSLDTMRVNTTGQAGFYLRV